MSGLCCIPLATLQRRPPLSPTHSQAGFQYYSFLKLLMAETSLIPEHEHFRRPKTALFNFLNNTWEALSTEPGSRKKLLSFIRCHVYTYTSICIYTCTYMCVCLHLHLHFHLYQYLSMFIPMCVCLYLHLYLHVYLSIGIPISVSLSNHVLIHI